MAFTSPALRSVLLHSKKSPARFLPGYSCLELTKDTNQAEQVATMRLMRGDKFPYPKPWPYKSVKLNSYLKIFSKTDSMLNENSKIVIVEGSAGVGKHEFGKRLAREFDLHFQPGIHDKHLWVNRHTLFDYRQLNEAFMPIARLMDFKELYNADEINIGRVERMQANALEKKVLNYGLGQLHLFSTGKS